MKSKALVILSIIVMTLALMAQSTTSNPAASGDAKACACCGHDQANGKMVCCGKGAACCDKGNDCCRGGSCCQGKDDKACPMMSKDQAGKTTCCTGGKCSMSSKDNNGKSCCGGKMCERPQAGA